LLAGGGSDSWCWAVLSTQGVQDYASGQNEASSPTCALQIDFQSFGVTISRVSICLNGGYG